MQTQTRAHTHAARIAGQSVADVAGCQLTEPLTVALAVSFAPRLPHPCPPLQIVKLLAAIPGMRLDDTIENEVAPLHMACSNGHMEVVKFLTSDPRVDVAMPQANGMTPFYNACYNGHLSLVKYLYRLPRVNVTTCTNDGFSPFYVACENGHTDVRTCCSTPAAAAPGLCPRGRIRWPGSLTPVRCGPTCVAPARSSSSWPHWTR